MSIIKIKRSGSSGAPAGLAQGEFAYSYLGGTEVNGGDRLYLGTGTETTGVAANIEVIGGKYFTDKLDHTPGTLTANSAIIVDTNNKIDILNVDNLTFDGNTISSTNLNGDIILDPNGTGVISIVGPLELTGNTTFTGSINITDDLVVGANVMIVDAGAGTIALDGDLTVTGSTQFVGTVDVNGQTTLSSLNVEDLTATRVVYSSTSGELVDDAGFTYTGAGATGNLQLTGSINVDVEATLASAIVEDLTNNRIVIAGTGGAIEDDANFTFDGATFNIGATGEFTVAVSSGNTQVKGTLDVDGQSTLASLNVQDLTATRITFAGTNGELEDSANLTFNSGTNTLTLTGTSNVTGQLNVDNLRLDTNTLSSTNTDGNILLDPDGDGYVQVVGTNGLVIPTGNTAQQGPSVSGAIRFNSEINQFEGYSGVNWSSLGGVRSVDGLTFIIAESSPGASDDILHFYAATSNTTTNEVAQLDDVSLRILNGTSSTSTTSGSLVVTGGVGISENLNVGGNVDIDGDLNIDGGDITTNLTTFNVINTTATTVNAFGAATLINIGAATSNTHINDDLNVDGDFTVGGTNFTVAGITGDIETAGSVIIGGDLTVNGNTTTVNVSTLEVEDALIRLASNNTTDSVDIGFVGNFNDGTAKIAGFFRDATDNEWYLFDEYVDANIDDNIIDTSSNTFSLGVLNIDHVNHTDFVIQLTGDISGSVTITDIGSTPTYTIATTVQPDSVALGADTTGNYVATITANTATGVSVTGTGEGAAVTVAGVIADAAGQLGVATYNATNFDVSVGGEVTIDTIDGGTY